MMEALIGAGCFWGIEEYYRKLAGVLNTSVGYSGGHTKNPTYEDVCSGNTEHVEVVQIEFDEKTISYKEVLDHFWLCHDPTHLNRQGTDIGRQYRSSIFFFSNDQKKLAVESKKKIQLSITNLIVTKISPAKEFYLAEDYHQLFIKKRA